MNSLQQKFLSLPLISKSPLATELWKEIVLKYGTKARAYHNLRHLEDMFQGLEVWVGPPILDEEILCFSIFYHDIIYKVPGKQNEARSALRAVEVLQRLGCSAHRIGHCKDQILATKTHQLNRNDDPDQAVLLDLDLAILGADRVRYAAYSLQIRKEYRIIPGPIYRNGRKKALTHLLEQERLYHTSLYQDRLESKARANLNWELGEL